MKRSLLRLLVACCVACLASVAQAAVPKPVDIEPEAERVPVWPALRIVVPADQHLSPGQAAELATGSQAYGVDGPERILGRGTKPHWAWFSLRNPAASGQLRLLGVESTLQFDVRLFERNDKGVWQQVKSLADAADGRIGGGSTYPVWELHLEPLQTRELLLRIEGPSIVRFPVFVEHPLSYGERQRTIHVVLGIALAATLIVAGYIGLLRRYLDPLMMYLSVGMLSADMVGAMWVAGLLGELFPAVPESTLSSIGFAAYALVLACGSLHTRVFLRTATWAPNLDRLLMVLAWFWLALAPWFALAFPVQARILLVVFASVLPLILAVISVLAARRKVPYSGFIVAAWVTYFATGASMLTSRLVGVFPLWFPNSLPLIQSTLVAILIGLAMHYLLMRQREAMVVKHQEVLAQAEKAAALMREKSLVFAATNHDLRQPLFGVSLFADLLKSAPTSAERRAHAHKLDMALKEVDDFLVGIQQLAVVHEVAYKPEFVQVKLDDLLAPLIEEYRGRAKYKRVTIRYVPSRLSITTHVPYFQRIVRNILSNAIRYGYPGGRVLVGCRRGGGLHLVIADTGRGMTEEQASRAFDAFQRFDVDKGIQDGFGLGLYSTKVLANALGLIVSLSSLSGRGTVFNIHLTAQDG